MPGFLMFDSFRLKLGLLCWMDTNDGCFKLSLLRCSRCILVKLAIEEWPRVCKPCTADSTPSVSSDCRGISASFCLKLLSISLELYYLMMRMFRVLMEFLLDRRFEA